MTATADLAPDPTAARESEAVPTPPVVDEQTIRFTYADGERRLRGVRLYQEVRIPGDELDFTHDGDAWRLTVARPAVDRLEYLLELTHRDGGSEMITDPSNPRRSPGAFGDKSVLELPGYQAPAWLGTGAAAGSSTDLDLPARSLRGAVHGRLWSPDGVAADEPLPLLVVHDGPEYDELAALTTYLSAMVADGTLPPLRAALLAPGPRDDWYSANGAYTRALCLAVVPRLRELTHADRIVGMGASLGALAMLHAQRRHAGTFDGLFLQSGSYFHPRFDAHERRFKHYDRVVRAVDAVLRAPVGEPGWPDPVPAVLTCGAIEENVENNRIMARALAAQGYDAHLHEVGDVHNYVAWRDAFHPHLTQLLRQVLQGSDPCTTSS